MSRQTRETNFISELKRSVRYYFPENVYWYKIPDDRKFKKPFDVFAAMNGRHFALEMKVHAKHTAWPLGDVAKHQIWGLHKAAIGGYNSWILVNVRLGLGNGQKNFVRVVPIQEYTKWALRSDRKSIPIDELESSGDCLYKIRVEEIGETIWKINDRFL